MKKLIVIAILAAPAFASKGFVVTRPTRTIVNPYQRSNGTTVTPYIRSKSAPNTGTIKEGKHPR